MKPSNLSRLLLLSLFLTVLFAAQSLAQRDDRAVRVQGRQDAGAEQRVALVIGNSAYKAISPSKTRSTTRRTWPRPCGAAVSR